MLRQHRKGTGGAIRRTEQKGLVQCSPGGYRDEEYMNAGKILPCLFKERNEIKAKALAEALKLRLPK